AAVEVVITTVPDNVQQPDKASSPAATLVVVNHIDGFWAVPQRAEQGFQAGFVRQQTRRRWLAELGGLGVDETGAGQMAFGIASGAGQVDEDQFGGLQSLGQLSRLDDQG